MVDTKKLRIKAVADGMIPSVELVLAKPLAWLADQGLVEYTLDVMSDVDANADLGTCDLLIVMRACMPDALALVENANAQNVPVIYAIDDDFEALDPETPLGKHYVDNRGWPRLLEICARSRQVWAFSPSVRSKILPVQDRVVVPNAIASVEQIRRELAQRKGASQSSKQPLVIGYGASHYHSRDLDGIAGPILEVLDRDPDVTVELIGVTCDRLSNHPQVRWFAALPSVDTYYKFVVSRNWTCGIAPLSRSPENDAKTDNKYREYAALGVPAVYSDAPPYRRSVIDDYNGVIALSLDDWRSGLERLLHDSPFRQALADNAYRDVLDRYSIEKVAGQYLNFIRSAIQKPVRVVVNAAPIPTTDIDVNRPFARLRAEGKLEWTFVPYGETVSPDLLREADLLVVSRIHDAATRRLVEAARTEFGVPVVFSWDDDFFSIPENLGSLARHHRDPENVRSLKDILSRADLVRASTKKLVERTRQYTDRVVETPYGFDFEQLDACAARPVRAFNDITIGFFGTPSHGASVDLLVGALTQVAKRAPHVRFEFFGPRTTALQELPRARFVPPVATSRDALVALSALDWDIGLAPLEINDFNRAKLPTKYRDYGACHIAGVYTRLDPYTAVVDHGVTGLLADNTEASWFEAIMRLVDDPGLRRSVAANAHAHVRKKLSLDQAVEDWRDLLDRFSPAAADPSEASEKQRKRMESLELRVTHLTRQVGVLRDASSALLDAQLHPFPPAGTLLGRLRRYLFVKLRDLGNATAFASVNMPGPGGPILALARIGAAGTVEGDAVPLLGPNLQAVPFVEYPIPERAVGGNRIRLATASLVPTLSGHIGIEIVTPGDQIHCHVLMPIEHMDPGQVAQFSIPEMRVDRAGWRIRCFARNSASPIHIYLRDMQAASGPAQSPLVFALEYESSKRLRTDPDELSTKQLVQSAGKVQKKFPRARAAKNRKIR